MPYIRSLAEHPCQYLFVYYFTVPQCLFSNIILLPLYRSLPCYSVRSYCAASAVLNSNGSDSRAAISRRSNKKVGPAEGSNLTTFDYYNSVTC